MCEQKDFFFFIHFYINKLIIFKYLLQAQFFILNLLKIYFGTKLNRVFTTLLTVPKENKKENQKSLYIKS